MIPRPIREGTSFLLITMRQAAATIVSLALAFLIVRVAWEALVEAAGAFLALAVSAAMLYFLTMFIRHLFAGEEEGGNS